MHGAYIGNNRVLIHTAWNARLLAVADDLSLTPELMVNGVFELPLTKYFIENVKSGMTVVDVGANIGYFTVLLGHLVGSAGRVLAYEANAELMPILIDNLAMNGQHHWVKVENKAVYSEARTLTFYRATRFRGNSSLYEPGEAYYAWFKGDSATPVSVEADSLDHLLAHVTHIDVLKMDIEGAELHAFLGLRNLLQRKAIRTIVFETNRLQLRDDWDKFCATLERVAKVTNGQFSALDSEGKRMPLALSEIIAQDHIPNVILDAR